MYPNFVDSSSILLRPSHSPSTSIYYLKYAPQSTRVNSGGYWPLRKKKLSDPFFFWLGFNCLKATATSGRLFTFNHSVPSNSWYLLYRPRKDERLSRPWSRPVVLSTEPMIAYDSQFFHLERLKYSSVIPWLPTFFNTKAINYLLKTFIHKDKQSYLFSTYLSSLKNSTQSTSFTIIHTFI